MGQVNAYNRRRFLKLTGMGGAIGLASGILNMPDAGGETNLQSSATAPEEKLPPVRVSPERVIRTVAGLRPYRPSGFVLRSEQSGNRQLVHNYGHGGGGVSLSWGTAVLAAGLVRDAGESEIAVAGCGVIGLSTARILQRRGHRVTIYTKDLPPETTSSIACASWSPGAVFEEKKAGSDFMNTFYRASSISQRIFQDYTGDKYGVWWMKNFFLGINFHFPGGRDLYPGFRVHKNEKIYFGYPEVEEIYTMMIETPVYLNALLADFYLAGGKIKIRTFTSARDLMHLKEKTVINCTGLGSAELFDDTELIPVKGQLSILLPQPEIDYSYVAHSPGNLLYMFPRKDGILLGGTFDRGNWSLEPDDQESARIIKGHASISEYLEKNNAP